ncbi:hypothetical protein PM082_010850 [Marasmius tenuissimus]|nr:hypothetical protein PM082_010850 [Marasmius tenuissimus]
MSWMQVADILHAPRRNYPGAEIIKVNLTLEELLGGKWRTLEDAVLKCAKDLLEKETRRWDKA